MLDLNTSDMEKGNQCADINAPVRHVSELAVTPVWQKTCWITIFTCLDIEKYSNYTQTHKLTASPNHNQIWLYVTNDSLITKQLRARGKTDITKLTCSVHTDMTNRGYVALLQQQSNTVMFNIIVFKHFVFTWSVIALELQRSSSSPTPFLLHLWEAVSFTFWVRESEFKRLLLCNQKSQILNTKQWKPAGHHWSPVSEKASCSCVWRQKWAT